MVPLNQLVDLTYFLDRLPETPCHEKAATVRVVEMRVATLSLFTNQLVQIAKEEEETSPTENLSSLPDHLAKNLRNQKLKNLRWNVLLMKAKL